VNEDYRDILAALVAQQAVHGYPRATVDLDIWIDPAPDNAHPMKIVIGVLVAASLCSAAESRAQPAGSPQPQQPMGFFVTSVGRGDGGNLGGLAGADAHCLTLAQAAGAGARTWHAYLSATAAAGQPPVNARDRIGSGPWYNAKGALIAWNVPDLHGDVHRDRNSINKEFALNEKGLPVNGRGLIRRTSTTFSRARIHTAVPCWAARQRRRATTGRATRPEARCSVITIAPEAAIRPGTPRTRAAVAVNPIWSQPEEQACSTASQSTDWVLPGFRSARGQDRERGPPRASAHAPRRALDDHPKARSDRPVVPTRREMPA